MYGMFWKMQAYKGKIFVGGLYICENQDLILGVDQTMLRESWKETETW